MVGPMFPFSTLYNESVLVGTSGSVQHWQYNETGPLKVDNIYIYIYIYIMSLIFFGSVRGIVLLRIDCIDDIVLAL